MSDSRIRIQVASVVLVIAFAFLAIIASYEVVNYGHEVKWTYSDGSDASYYSVQYANGTLYVYDQGYAVEKVHALNLDGTVKWSTGVESQPVVAGNGTVYVQKTTQGDSGPSLCAIDRDGRIMWSYEVSNGTFWQTALGPDGNVYTHRDLYSNNTSYGTDFMAFSPEGRLLWQRHFQYVEPCVVLPNGTVVMHTEDGNLTAFSPNGSILWQRPSDAYLLSGPVRDGVVYYVVNLADISGLHADLHAFDLNGTLLWQYPGWTWSGRNVAQLQCTVDPIVDDPGTIYFTRYNATGSTPYTSLFAMNPNGTLKWEYRDSIIGPPSIRNGLIVFGSSSGLTALDSNGKVEWKLGGSFDDVFSRPAFGADSTIYATTSNGNYQNANGIVAVGENPIFLEVGALILLPIIVACLIVIWRLRAPSSR